MTLSSIHVHSHSSSMVNSKHPHSLHQQTINPETFIILHLTLHTTPLETLYTRATNVLAEPVETTDDGGLNTLNTTRAVVIKFMADEVQFRNEVKARADAHFDPNYVVSILGTSDDFEGFAELSEKLGFYRYAIIMEAGERNIHSVFVHERPDEVGQGSQSRAPCHTHAVLLPSLATPTVHDTSSRTSQTSLQFSTRGIFIRVLNGTLHLHAKGEMLDLHVNYPNGCLT